MRYSEWRVMMHDLDTGREKWYRCADGSAFVVRLRELALATAWRLTRLYPNCVCWAVEIDPEVERVCR